MILPNAPTVLAANPAIAGPAGPTAHIPGPAANNAFLAILNEQLQFANGTQNPLFTSPGAPFPGTFPRPDLAGVGNGLPGTPGLGSGGFAYPSGAFPTMVSMTVSRTVVFGLANPELSTSEAELAALFKGLDISKFTDSPITPATPGLTTAAATAAAQSPAVSIPKDPVDLGNKIGDRLVDLDKNGYKQAGFVLQTPQYGPVQVQIDINGGKVNLAIGTQDAGLQAALKAATESISTTLKDNGLALASFDISGTPSVANGKALTASQGAPANTANAINTLFNMLSASGLQTSPLGLVNDFV